MELLEVSGLSVGAPELLWLLPLLAQDLGTNMLSDEHELAESLLVAVLAGVALGGVGAGMLVWHEAGTTPAVASTHESTATGRVAAAAGGAGAAAVALMSSKVLAAGAAGKFAGEMLTGSMALSRNPSWSSEQDGHGSDAAAGASSTGNRG